MAPDPRSSRSAPAAGLAYGLAAYLAWGFIAIYFKQLAAVPPPAVLAHRVVWSVAFLGLLLVAVGQARDVVRCLRDRRTLLVLLASTVMIAANWFTFIWAVSSGRLTEASFGYFVNPLVNVLLGVLVLKERLRPWQLAAIALATLGVGVMSYRTGGIPVVTLVLAGSFGVYGLLRKVAPVGPLVGLSVETMLLLPVALAYVVLAPPAAGTSLAAYGHWTAGLLMLGGVVTAMPLLWFAAAARRLRLATLGFLQYLAPTCQLLLAVLAYGEPFTGWHAASFGLIWLAIGVFSADAVRALRRAEDRAGEPRAAEAAEPPSREVVLGVPPTPSTPVTAAN